MFETAVAALNDLERSSLCFYGKMYVLLTMHLGDRWSLEVIQGKAMHEVIFRGIWKMRGSISDKVPCFL